MKKYAALFLAVITLVICSCSGKKLAYEYKDGEENYVVLTVTTHTGEVVLDNYKVAFRQEATILDCTLYALQTHKIHYEISGSGKMAYMKEIHQLAEFGEGAESGWLYRVNGSFDSASSSIGTYKVKHNDVIEWVYTTDMGKTEGSEFE